jgi:long-chain acyl-CoA synthetase
MADDDLRHVVADSEARWVFTTTRLAQRLAALGLDHNFTIILLDAAEADERSWQHYVSTRNFAFPSIQPSDTAVLFYTSGTTGLPKGVPLTHRNLAANHDAMLALHMVDHNDRMLSPLPLHHVYAFTAGMLAPLALGVPLVLPASLTGPEIVRALREEKVTTIISVPRFYEALVTAIETRVQQRGRLVTEVYTRMLALSVELRRRFGWSIGRLVFAPLHKQFAPYLRKVGSAGAALDPALAWKMEGLGWSVTSGYGLTETSPMLTYNPPGAGRLDTAGKPVPGVDIRIAPPAQDQQYGEVQAKGPNVFSSYLHLPEKTKATFTEDGYFRTGDVGYLDNAGYLHLVGRGSEMIVLAGGENIRPDMVESAFARGEHIREAGVLEHDNHLVALIVPTITPTPDRDIEQIKQLIRHEVEQLSRALPSHHRISDYALTLDPLPRTGLGKLRRHTLAQRYHQATRQRDLVTDTGPLPFAQMSLEDRQLLEDVTALRMWEWLARRFPNVRLTPDTHLQLDLGIDSLSWLTLTLEIRAHAHVDLDEEAISRIATIRDLLRETVAAEQVTAEAKAPLEELRQPEALLSEQQRHWLQPPGWFDRALGMLLHPFNRLLMRSVFNLQVKGLEHLPQYGPFIVTPNHVSLLDPLAVAAALPQQHLQRTYWGGWTGIMFANPLMRLVSRAARVVPIDPQRGPLSNLAFGIAALKRDNNLVWFPEGERSRTGRLQHFRSGIGLVLSVQPVPVVPVWIAGTYEALPPGQSRLHHHPINVTFGKPVDVETLQRIGEGKEPHERIANALWDCVASLGGQERPQDMGEQRPKKVGGDAMSSGS